MAELILHHQEAETACLGAALFDGKAAQLVAATLTAADFTRDDYRDIFTAIRRLVSRGTAVDRLTLYTELQANRTNRIPASNLVALEEAVPTAANVQSYTALVRQASIRRQLRAAGQQLAEKAADPGQDLVELVGRLSEELERALRGEDRGEASRVLAPVSFAEGLRAWQRACDQEPEPRIPTPFPALTYYLDGGFGPGELIYLGAVASTGKTALALELARTAALAGTGVLIISREMVVRSLVRRIVAQAVRIPARTLRRGTLSPEQWEAYSRAYQDLVSLPIWMSDQAASLRDITGLVERWSCAAPLGLLIVDYLQLVFAPSQSRRNEVEVVSQGLKTIALRQGIPVLALSSLSRSLDPKSRPGLSRLKESSNLEHDADVVMFLYRENEQTEETECIIAKQRDGAKGTVHLRFRPEFVAFEQAQQPSAG